MSDGLQKTLSDLLLRCVWSSLRWRWSSASSCRGLEVKAGKWEGLPLFPSDVFLLNWFDGHVLRRVPGLHAVVLTDSEGVVVTKVTASDDPVGPRVRTSRA
jgi:hypothetical protein